LAGGHLGFKPRELNDPRHRMENLLPDVLMVAANYGNFPVIVAGGLFDRADILYWKERGASGFQFGTRFLATKESGASEATKKRIVECKEKDIVIAHNDFGLRQSPAMHPFRVLMNSPGFNIAVDDDVERKKCLGCPILKNGQCSSLDNPQKFFCIGRGLLGVIGKGKEEESIITVGANAHRIEEIITVERLFQELTDEK